MEYVCTKSISLAGSKYHPGDIIPDGIILDSRVGKLKSSGYITDVDTSPESLKENKGIPTGTDALYTKEELDATVAEAVNEAVNNTVAEMQQKQAELQEYVAELQETSPEAYAGTFMIPVKAEDGEGDNAQYISLPMTPEGIVQVVSVMQSKANDGVEAIAGIEDENVLILIHALDSRVTVKNAAKKQAGTLTSTDADKNDARDGNESIEPSTADDNNKSEDGVMPQDGEGK